MVRGQGVEVEGRSQQVGQVLPATAIPTGRAPAYPHLKQRQPLQAEAATPSEGAPT